MTILEWFIEPFSLGFQQRALLGGVLAGLMCAVVGTWLVLRGMRFFGDAFVHGVVPGIAAAVVLDVSPARGAALAAVVMVAGIEIVSRQTRLSEDAAIGLLVGPPATAALVVRTVPRMMAVAAALSVVSVWLGLLLSYHLGTAGSATMALVPIVTFFLTLAWTTVRARWTPDGVAHRPASTAGPTARETAAR